MTRATQHGWGTPATIGLLAGSAAWSAASSRSRPVHGRRCYRYGFPAAHAAGGQPERPADGGAVFSQFFLLALYMQQVLHYSALKTGVAYIGLTLSIITFSAIAQAAVTRLGIRRVLPVGLALSTVALVLFAQLPVHGDYFTDMFPAFLLSGVGLALAFVPTSIGALTVSARPTRASPPG